jgi:hypothetical protein
MTDSPLLNNSMAWVHYRMKGGLRNAFLFAAGYFLIVGGLIVFSVRVDPRAMQSTLQGWMIALLFLQIGILVLYGGGAVRNVIRKDFTTGMIASHRLMPISGTEAMVGYVLGSAAQPVAVAIANLLLGVLVTGPASLNTVDWLKGNALLGLFALCAWIVVAAIAMLSPKSAGGLMAGLMILAVPGSMILVAVPALTAICSPLVGPTIYGLVMKGSPWSPVLHTSTSAQVAVTILFFIAGARKFRRDDVLAVGPILGLVLVAMFSVISIAAILNWRSLQPMLFGMTGRMPELQLISSTIMGLLLAFLPVSAAAWLQESYHRRKRLGDSALGRRPLNFVVVAIVAAALIAMMGRFCSPMGRRPYHPEFITFLCLAAALLPIGCVMRWRYRTRSTAATFVCLWIVVAWVGPWLVSAAIVVARGYGEAVRLADAWEQSEFITGFSPIGTIIAVWASPDIQLVCGLVFQVVLAAVVFALARRRRDTGEIIVPVLASA